MKVLLAVCFVAIVLGSLFLFIRSRVVPTHHVRSTQVARVLEQLRQSTADPTFAVFMFSTPDQPGSERALNIQFSLENGRAGFDWVLLAPRNVEDEARFIEFAVQRGFSPKKHEENDVKYWRVERGDIAKLCADVIDDVYKIATDSDVELITEGFTWQP